MSGKTAMDDVISRKDECPVVERMIWDKVAVSFGDFEGVHKLTLIDLYALRSAIEGQIQEQVNLLNN